jgi:demethylmenaquinone methyltransferase/2-methoxy-6-polyprenyl-1,4-benzoquinol methylase
MVHDLFSSIHHRYDFLNHLFSLRRDIAWRRFAVRKMVFSKTRRYLDVATGTADLAVEAARLYRDIQVIGVDFVRTMMTVGAEKIGNQQLRERVQLIQGDALDLPFPDDHFDVTGIAFGIRNIPTRKQALAEMKRVTVPGGQVMVLEMNFPQNRLIRLFYARYLVKVLPYIARFLSRNPAAYVYLADSIIHFPTPEAFVGIMKDTGLTDVKKYRLSWGITHLYVGIKAADSRS